MDNLKVAFRTMVKMDGKQSLKSLIMAQGIALAVMAIVFLSYFLINNGHALALIAFMEIASVGVILFAIADNFIYRWKRISRSDRDKQAYIKYLEGDED